MMGKNRVHDQKIIKQDVCLYGVISFHVSSQINTSKFRLCLINHESLNPKPQS